MLSQLYIMMMHVFYFVFIFHFFFFIFLFFYISLFLINSSRFFFLLFVLFQLRISFVFILYSVSIVAKSVERCKSGLQVFYSIYSIHLHLTNVHVHIPYSFKFTHTNICCHMLLYTCKQWYKETCFCVKIKIAFRLHDSVFTKCKEK